MADVIVAINEAIDKREEGIVIKDPSAVYKPSKRKGKNFVIIFYRTLGAFQ